MTGQLPFDPRYENAVDLLLALLFSCFLTIFLTLNWALDPIVTSGCVFFGIYEMCRNAWRSPLRRSKLITPNPALHSDFGDRLEVRVSEAGHTCAIDLGIKKYIVFSSDDYRGTAQKWRTLIHHELAHLKNRDAVFFQFANVIGVMVVVQLVCFLAIGFGLGSLATGGGFNPDGPAVGLWITATFVTVTSVFLMWISDSLHRREFNADAYAYKHSGAHYMAWLRRAHRRSALKSPSTLSNWSRRLLNRFGSFSHPSYALRLSMIEATENQQPSKLVRDCIFSILLLFTFGFALALFFMQDMLDVIGERYAYLYFVFFFIAVLLLAVFSIIQMSYIERKQIRIYAFYWLVSFTSAYTLLIGGLFIMYVSGFHPLEASYSRIIFSLSSMILFSIVLSLTLFAANSTLKRIVPVLTFNVIVHIVMVIGCYLVALLATRQMFSALRFLGLYE